MMMSFRLACVACAFLMVAASSAAAAVEPVSGINIALLRAAPPDDLGSPETFEKMRQDNRKRLDVAVAGGFRLIRLRFHMILVGQDAPPPQRDTILRLMSDFVSAANARGVTVLVALFAENGHDQHDLICDNPARFQQAIGTVLRALPDSPLAGLEPLNEPFTGCGAPSGPQRWVNLQQVIYKKVRMERPHAIFVVSGDNWGGDLVKLDPAPYRNDPAVLFSLHFYDPMIFTHQGANWSFLPGFNRYVRNLPWPFEQDAVDRVKADAFSRIDADASLDGGKRDALKKDLAAGLSDYRRSGAEANIAAAFDQLANWAASQGVPKDRVFLGEFGVLRPSQNTKGGIMPDGDHWIKAVVTQARQRGFQWAVWDLDTSFAIAFGAQGDADKICAEFAEAVR